MLTNLRNIGIGAGITTEKTTSYDWNGIWLIDTPGIYTERKDHDEITNDAIRQADLLVFCLTHSLFDFITVENFKNLAYERKYRQKMMLVINKMSAEAGREDEKIRNYKESITDALQPHDPREFPTCFIDARDYLNGIDENDEELEKLSRFGTFIEMLNDFVQRKGTLARLDTPIRIVIEHLNEASSILARNKEEDNAYLELLERLSKAVDRGRGQLRTKIRNISIGLSSHVADEGVALAHQVGEAEDFGGLLKKAEAQIQCLSESAAKEMEQAINKAIGFLQERISEILNSSLARTFVICLDAPDFINARPFVQNDSVKRLKTQVERISQIAQQVGLEEIVKRATVAGQSDKLFIRATQAASSNLHQTIYHLGKFAGFNFKPWQAVNLAKNIGNVMKVVGPILSAVSVIVDIADARQEAKNERELADARREIDSQFLAIAHDFEQQFEKNRIEVEKELYERVEEDIHKARAYEKEAIAQSNRQVQHTLDIRTKLEHLLEEISLLP